MEGLTKALLNYNKALLNYNYLIQTKQINSEKHEKIRFAYFKVIKAYNNLIDRITRLKKDKKVFEKSYRDIMQDFLDNNPDLADPTIEEPILDEPSLDEPSTQKKSNITRTTRTIGGYHTRSLICRSQCRTKRKRKRKIP